ncbi:hypothetical protein MAR_017731 [Mya arenaria]|uniref:Uncharacterized protein n=1 Tax=Mya arenaria TaxID=6604 RepID=A0ABY7ECN4_MYAAR|nr:hypothetical protein MAR_017731 [Mya arenaria]
MAVVGGKFTQHCRIRQWAGQHHTSNAKVFHLLNVNHSFIYRLFKIKLNELYLKHLFSVIP